LSSDYDCYLTRYYRQSSPCLCLPFRSVHQSPLQPEWMNRPVVGLVFAGESVRVTAVVRHFTRSKRDEIRNVLDGLYILSRAKSFLKNAHTFTSTTAFALRFTPSCVSACHNECPHRIEKEEFERLFPAIPLITLCSDLVFGQTPVCANRVHMFCGHVVPPSPLLYLLRSTLFVMVVIKN